jgi:signal transduction histidine kinase
LRIDVSDPPLLIENIFAHTPAGVGYRLSVRTVAGKCVLSISDDGPGFVDLAVRRRGRSGGGSTGLGLDIVERTAERTGGGMAIGTSRDGGAEVSVTFGLAGGHRRVEKGAELGESV